MGTRGWMLGAIVPDLVVFFWDQLLIPMSFTCISRASRRRRKKCVRSTGPLRTFAGPLILVALFGSCGDHMIRGPAIRSYWSQQNTWPFNVAQAGRVKRTWSTLWGLLLLCQCIVSQADFVEFGWGKGGGILYRSPRIQRYILTEFIFI